MTGWRGLLEIYSEAQTLHDDEQSAPPAACPNDGTPLIDKDGILFCPFDGWKWHGSRSITS